MRLQVEPGVDSKSNIKSNIKSTIRDREEVEVEVEVRATTTDRPSVSEHAARNALTASGRTDGGFTG